MLMMLEANSSYKEGDRTSWWCHIYSLSAVSAVTYIGPRDFSLGVKGPHFSHFITSKGCWKPPLWPSWILMELYCNLGQICKDNMTRANGHSHAVLSNSVVQICIMFTLENIHNSHQPLFKVHWFFFTEQPSWRSFCWMWSICLKFFVSDNALILTPQMNVWRTMGQQISLCWLYS